MRERQLERERERESPQRFRPGPHPARPHNPFAMSAARAVCELDAAVVGTMLKAHVTSLEDAAYASSDMEVVVEKYEGLLVSLAASTDRITKSVVTQASASIFSASPSEHRMFGQQIAGAFAYCRGKWKKSTTGVRLSAPVRSVIRAWTKQTPRPSAGLSPSPSPKPSGASPGAGSSGGLPATPPPKKVRKEDIYQMYGVDMPKAGTPTTSCMEIFSSQEVLTQSTAASPVRPERRASSSSVEWVDMNRLVFVRMSPGGVQEEAPLIAGPSGFATAFVGGVSVDTEVPNLLLERGPRGQVFKRPAGEARVERGAQAEEGEAGEGGEDEGEEASEEGPAAAEVPRAGQASEEGPAAAEVPRAGRTYSKMYYKNSGAFGVRQRFGGKRQVACVSGRRLGLDKERLAVVTDEAISKLESGEVMEGAIKEWIAKALSELSS